MACIILFKLKSYNDDIVVILVIIIINLINPLSLIYTKNLEAIKSLTVKAPLLHLPSRNGKFYLECDSSAQTCRLSFVLNSK